MEIKENDIVTCMLALAVTLGFFGILAYLIKFGVPANGGEPLLVMLGSLGTAWTMIIGYYFGSSVGSKNKDKSIETLSNPKA